MEGMYTILNMSRNNRKNDFKKFQWVSFLIIFVLYFVMYQIAGFTSNCIFEWPIRWDAKACWLEQVHISNQKAFEKASNFAP
jgi:hypothetical protein